MTEAPEVAAPVGGHPPICDGISEDEEGELWCSLALGHEGQHYDAIRDRKFSTDAVHANLSG